MNFFEKILEIEQKYNVHDLRYNNYFVWPLVKNRLLFDAVAATSGTIRKKDCTPETTKYKPKKTLNGYIEILKSVFKLNSFNTKLKREFANKKYLGIDGVNATYVDTINNKKYSRYLTPYIEKADERGGILLLNLTREDELGNKNFTSFYHSISNFYELQLFKYKLLLKFKRDGRAHNLEEFNSELDKINYPVKLNISELGFALFEIEVYEKIYRKLLNKIKPAAIFIECFYGNPNHAGLMLAAKEKNIKVVDIQHGVSFDSMYLGWSKSPEEGYKMLPDYFWTWSTYDFETVEESRNGSRLMKPLLGGNMWYKKYISGMTLSKEDKYLTALKKSFRKVILIALDHSRKVDEYLVDVVKNSPKDWLFLVRFHPHDYITPGYRDSYIKYFNDFDNVEYANSTLSSLYHLLSLVDYNISYFSSVCVEAISFRIPSVILGGTKIKQFEALETNKCFRYSTNADEILDVILNEKLKVSDEMHGYFRLKYEDVVIDKLFQTIGDQ